MNHRLVAPLLRLAARAEIEIRFALGRWWLPPGHARQLRAVRRRLASQPSAWQVATEEARLANDLRTMREELCARFRRVEACTSCARGHVPPAGRWPGGHCCSGKTVVFSDDELASLRLSGTAARDLKPAGAGDGGCVFRGPHGCALRAAHRPNLCVRYLCTSLDLELQRRGNRAGNQGNRLAHASRLHALRRAARGPTRRGIPQLFPSA